MSESEQYVSVITVESDNSNSVDKEIKLSKKNLVLNTNKCSDDIQPEESVAIIFETIEQNSVNSEIPSNNSPNCVEEQTNDENGITNEAFVDDNEVNGNLKKGHQRSPSRMHEKEEMVCSQGMSQYIPT